MPFFDFLKPKQDPEDLLRYLEGEMKPKLNDILDNNIKPLEGYIKKKEYEEALQALHNATLNLMNYLDSNIRSDAHFLIDDEVKRVFSEIPGSWYIDFILTVMSDIKSLGHRIDIEMNLKIGTYAICELFNSISHEKKAPLYFKDFAKKHSII
ncbi:hypothetical protein THIOKS11210012 [Thiocapsa sp. KS1]|nr:hypothetical protein [Thiocapsa sp. KS1]CRI63196.1 hypothetical protein THIOKS11210012 [Thiocapsa sp. KS1]